MVYVPINADAYTAAYSGAVAGMAVGSWITSASIANYALVCAIAGAFAEEFDIVWNNATQVNSLEYKAMTSVCANEFMVRQPGPLAEPAFQVPATWFIPASACAALVLQSDAYFAAQGIVPPGIGAPLSNANPVNVDGTAAAPGAAGAASRADHKHDVNFGVPTAVGAANGAGTSDNLARADHVHDASVLPTLQSTLFINWFSIVGQKFTELSVTIAGTTNNYDPANIHISDVLRVTLTGSQDLTGIDAPITGENTVLIIQNVDTVDKLTLKHESGSSTAANRFFNPQALDIVLGPAEAARFYYDSTQLRWVPFANTGQVYDMVSSWFRLEEANGPLASGTITFKNGNKQRVTLNGTGTLTLSFPGIGNYILKVIQDGTGGRVPTLAVSGGSVFKPGGVLVFSTGANDVDLLGLYYDGTNVWATIAADFT